MLELTSLEQKPGGLPDKGEKKTKKRQVDKNKETKNPHKIELLQQAPSYRITLFCKSTDVLCCDNDFNCLCWCFGIFFFILNVLVLYDKPFVMYLAYSINLESVNLFIVVLYIGV